MRSPRSTLVSVVIPALLWAVSPACGGKKPEAPDAAAVTPDRPDKPVAGEHGHDEAHVHKAPHGGTVVSAGNYHIEAVATKMGLVIYLLDDKEKELPVAGVEGSVLVALKDGSAPKDVPLSAMGNHLMADIALSGAWTAVASLKVKGETLTGRFEGATAGEHADAGHDHGAAGHAHDHGAAGHDHGAMAMYACPMHPEVMSDKPGACPKCGMALVAKPGDAAGGHDHGAMKMPMASMALSSTVESHLNASGSVEAGKPTRLNFAFHAMPGQALVKDFEVSHERKLHVFIVSQDLSFYDHVHPDPTGDGSAGTWQLDQTFPAPGVYRVYSDFKSTALGANVTVSDFTVPGTAPAPKPLVVDSVMNKAFGGLTVAFAPSPTPFKAGVETILKYTMADAKGSAVTDLEPYLGAMGHLFVLGDDLVTMAHSHPEGMERGPDVSFHAVFPKAGRYKLWAQFQRAGKIVTSDYVVDVL